jgi:hypothetical protein
LTYDGPGQGGVLRQREVPYRPDWEAVVTHVVDFAVSRPELDPDRMVLIGRSFGGYLAPRGAAFEHRLGALIADPGQLDMFDMVMARVPQEMREAIERDDPKVDSVLEKLMEDEARRFYLAARMRASGAKTLKEFLLMQREYSLKGLVEKIECPTLVCDNVADAIGGGQANELYEALVRIRVGCRADTIL